MNYNLLWFVWLIWAAGLVAYCLKGNHALPLWRGLSAPSFSAMTVVITTLGIVVFNKGMKMFKRKENTIKSIENDFFTSPPSDDNRSSDPNHLTDNAEAAIQAASPMDATTIPESCHLTGEINATGDVHISGSIKGIIRSEKTVYVLSEGKVDGEITADKIEVTGSLTGLCRSREVAINVNGFVDGTIECEALSINKKGRFYGVSKPFSTQTVTDKASGTKRPAEPYIVETLSRIEEQIKPS
ncbi:hypothetical protein ED28_11680 [[Pantoea] beijingensis]|uniref:Polymer-forming cytoskeletal protein n=1 Tax=[Pantoea] beijingensis TaxID=1324864 RepID=A0A443IBZ3_9GAMM|nr:polymer-forming cytoskeletal protein [[Pantoea] beijingensis]RWR01682.1 hypothetical protein ED28_11680 [[Pantoea] beijingensis]